MIEVSGDPRGPWTRVDGRDVSAEIRGREISTVVSAVASVPEVRAHLIRLQRAIIAAAVLYLIASGKPGFSLDRFASNGYGELRALASGLESVGEGFRLDPDL